MRVTCAAGKGVQLRGTVKLPALFVNADAGARRNRARHFGALGTELGCLVASAGFSSWLMPRSDLIRGSALVVPGLLFGAFAARVVREAANYESRWFGCRAIAESTRGLSWRYMMCSDPFRAADPASLAADQRFALELQAMSERLSHALEAVPILELGASEITEAMREVRALDVRERAALYHRERVLQQQTWYERGAALYRSARAAWAWLSLFGDLGAASLAILAVRSGGASWGAATLLAAIAASAIAWSQAHRHSQTSQSYRLVAQALAFMAARRASVVDDATLESYVSEVESLISREHSVWLARQ
jgi:hypothetical protein